MCDQCSSVSDFQTAALREQVQFALARKQLDATKSQGGAIVSLLQAAVELGKAPDRGEAFDAQA